MSAHTPGPWTALLDPPRTQRRKRMALVSTPNGRMAIDCTNSGATYAEDCANARLIAAAPELLALLRTVPGLFYTHLNDARPDVDAAIRHIAALVEKVEGR